LKCASLSFCLAPKVRSSSFLSSADVIQPHHPWHGSRNGQEPQFMADGAG
jgi:hypothetical protein